jgi:AbrB family looped-hinge helix DNA binding protein
MQTKISTKGQVVLPGPLRRRLGLQPGDTLDAKLSGGGVLLTPRKRRAGKAKIFIDKKTGFPVLTAGKNAPILTSEQVREILADFP